MAKKVKKLVGSVLKNTIGGVLGVFGGDSPDVPSTPAAPDSTPTPVSADTEAAREAAKKRQARAAGLAANTLTRASGLGESNATTGLKTLLG